MSSLLQGECDQKNSKTTNTRPAPTSGEEGPAAAVPAKAAKAHRENAIQRKDQGTTKISQQLQKIFKAAGGKRDGSAVNIGNSLKRSTSATNTRKKKSRPSKTKVTERNVVASVCLSVRLSVCLSVCLSVYATD